MAIIEERQGDTAFTVGFAMKIEELGGIEELQDRIKDGMRPKNREGFLGGLLDLGEGALDSVVGTVEMLHGLIPLNLPGPLAPYSTTPGEAAENWANLGRGSGTRFSSIELDQAFEYANTEAKLEHVVGNARHGFDQLVESSGGRSAAMRKLVNSLADGTGLPEAGKSEVVRIIDGAKVTIRGAVVDSIPKIGTAFIAP